MEWSKSKEKFEATCKQPQFQRPLLKLPQKTKQTTSACQSRSAKATHMNHNSTAPKSKHARTIAPHRQDGGKSGNNGLHVLSW